MMGQSFEVKVGRVGLFLSVGKRSIWPFQFLFDDELLSLMVTPNE